MLSLSVDQNIQNYNTCEDYIRSSTKLQHLLTCRRKRQMLKKTSNQTPSEAGSGTNKRGSSNKRPHLSPHFEEELNTNNYYYKLDNIQPASYYHHHEEPDIGVRTNKIMKFKHAGFQSESYSSFIQQYQSQYQKASKEFVQQSTQEQQIQPKNLEKSPKQSIVTGACYNAENNSKHLVKSISDLPVFVTIEGFRVASYSIGGEPHLCLPQLLQFLKQNFTIKRLIDKFEESVVNFPSATPKQVEGFVKSSVLPQNASSCPLIRRSDADKICLGLYEQCSKTLRSDIVKLCSQQVSKFGEGTSKKAAHNSSPVTNNSVTSQPTIEGFPQVAIKSESSNVKDDDQSDSTNSSRITNYGNSKSENHDKLSPNSCNTTLVDDDKNKRPVDSLDASSTNQYINNQQQPRSVSIIRGTLDSKSNLAKYTTDCEDGDDDSEQIDHSIQNKSLKGDSKIDSDITKKPPLFESEAQNSILALARAVTSTLIIRVYHKCFGKCLGLYYPSLLVNCNSKCIECANCKLMLSPRRFIGHTHGSEEKDLCHWGFNSYNWRSYIRLSRKQTQNNLDDDELLIQFRTLLSVSSDEANENDNDDYEFDKQQGLDENYSLYGDRIKETKVEQQQQQQQQHVSSIVPPSYRIQKKKYMANAPITPIMADKNIPDQALGVNPLFECLPAETSSTYKLMADPPLYLPSSDKVDLRSANSSIGIPLPPVPLPLTSDVMRPLYVHNQQSQPYQQQQVVPHPPSAAQHLAALPAEAYYNFAWSPLAAQASSAQPSIYNSPRGIGDSKGRSQQPFLASKRSSSFSISNASNNYWSSERSTSVAGSTAMFKNEHLTRQLSLDSETKREIYICNNLTSYLGNKGLSLGLTNDIVETTLDIVRKSKALF